MTTGRINQITLCRPCEWPPRAQQVQPNEFGKHKPDSVRFYAHRETSLSKKLDSHAVLTVPVRVHDATHAKVSPVVSNRTVARRLDNYVSRPCYHGSEVPNLNNVTRVARRVKMRKWHRHPLNGTTLRLNQRCKPKDD
jgi:hypothetical protein